jgi:hypothetical protein
MLRAINPTLNFQPGNIASLPFPLEKLKLRKSEIDEVVEELVSIYKKDWDDLEGSWEMKSPPIFLPKSNSGSLQSSWENWNKDAACAVDRASQLEKSCNFS